jgi:hypothetical protein
MDMNKIYTALMNGRVVEFPEDKMDAIGVGRVEVINDVPQYSVSTKFLTFDGERVCSYKVPWKDMMIAINNGYMNIDRLGPVRSIAVTYDLDNNEIILIPLHLK